MNLPMRRVLAVFLVLLAILLLLLRMASFVHHLGGRKGAKTEPSTQVRTDSAAYPA
jgi:hypothetical protein